MNTETLTRKLQDSQFGDSLDYFYHPYITTINSILFGDKENDPFEVVIFKTTDGRINHIGLEYAHMVGLYF